MVEEIRVDFLDNDQRFPLRRLGTATHPLLHNGWQYPSNELFEGAFCIEAS
jgi:hypothetical protein